MIMMTMMVMLVVMMTMMTMMMIYRRKALSPGARIVNHLQLVKKTDRNLYTAIDHLNFISFGGYMYIFYVTREPFQSRILY